MAKSIACPNGKVIVIVEEFGGVIDDVYAYCSKKEADKHYSSFVKEHWGTQKKHLAAREGDMSKEEIWHYTTHLLDKYEE